MTTRMILQFHPRWGHIFRPAKRWARRSGGDEHRTWPKDAAKRIV